MNAADVSEDVDSRNVNVHVQLVASLSEANPDGLRLDDAAKLAFQRLGRIMGDYAHTLQQREAGFDATYDHIDRVRERLQEFCLAALLKKSQKPPWQPETCCKGEAERREPSCTQQQCENECHPSQQAAD